MVASGRAREGASPAGHPPGLAPALARARVGTRELARNAPAFSPPQYGKSFSPCYGMSMSDEIRVLVCGGRDYADRAAVFQVLDGLHRARPFGLVIHGGARGADALAGEWAAERGVPRLVMKADWKTHGKAAGPIRNQAMLERKPDAVVAFPGGAGTRDMVRRADKAGVRIFVPVPIDDW